MEGMGAVPKCFIYIPLLVPQPYCYFLLHSTCSRLPCGILVVEQHFSLGVNVVFLVYMDKLQILWWEICGVKELSLIIRMEDL